MSRSTLLLALITLLFSALNSIPALGHDPLSVEDPERAALTSGAVGLAAARLDTLYLLSPDDGDFEDSVGNPDWSGWVSTDVTAATSSYWQVSTYNAAALDPDVIDNHAWWCGSLEYASCGAADPIGGYGNHWRQTLEFQTTFECVNKAAVTIIVDSDINVEAEPDYDFLMLQARTDDDDEYVVVDVMDTVTNDTTGVFDKRVSEFIVDCVPGLSTLYLRYTFVSDGSGSDEDCLFPTAGAAQIDNIRVYIDGVLVDGHVEDCEPGTPQAWFPVLNPGVGDFAALRNNLGDWDPCRRNASYQVTFVDDGMVVPGTGGSPCITWCYGPGGWVLNAAGGLAGPGRTLHNEVRSPVVAMPQGTGNAIVLRYDVYRDSLPVPGSPGMHDYWRIRSTASADPADIENATWRDRDILAYGRPRYQTEDHDLTDLLVPEAQWLQLALGVQQVGWPGDFDSYDATPAPYFDNVSIVAITASGPRLAVRTADLAQDGFPEQGFIDYTVLASNHVRFDAARRAGDEEVGDSIVVRAVPTTGSSLTQPPRMHYLLDPNPLFDPIRTYPNSGYVVGDSLGHADGAWIAGMFSFDLPDTGVIYPGDVVHYYFEAEDAGGITWFPGDTTGYGDFTTRSAYSPDFTVRALPTLHSTTPGDQPSVLWWNDDDDPGARQAWLVSLQNLGFAAGVDVDIYETNAPSHSLTNGLGSSANFEVLRRYTTILYASGNRDGGLIDTADAEALTNWVYWTYRRILLSGDNVASWLTQGDVSQQYFLAEIFGMTATSRNLWPLFYNVMNPLVGVTDPLVVTSVPEWAVWSGCGHGTGQIDVVEVAGGYSLAEYLLPDGNPGGVPYVALGYASDMSHWQRAFVLPYDFTSIVPIPGSSSPGADPIATRTRILGDILAYMDEAGGDPIGVPEVTRFQVLGPAPNPFNPATVIDYELPRRAHVAIKVYDLRGRLVRVVLDEVLDGGRHTVRWDGKDDAGHELASGVYLGRAESGATVQSFKMVLLR